MTQWIDKTIPFSDRFDDTYYSKLDGLAETDHVFIETNKLPDRWKNCDHFTIAELGFGTGLNFLRTAQRWQKEAKKSAHLHFISFEQYPLSTTEMQKALSRWAGLKQETQRMLEFWSQAKKMKTLEAKFSPNITVTIHFGDANKSLLKCEFSADAWYLDGFAPSKNPQLWNETLMKEVFTKTKPSGTFATYTAAGFVKRNLISAGFEVSKVPGFGNKREMLCGSRKL